MTTLFNEEEQNKEIDLLHKEEEEELVRVLSDTYGIPYIDLRGMTPETDAMTLFQEEEALETHIAPFKLVGKKLFIATTSPYDPKLQDVLRPLEEKGMELTLFLCSHASLLHVTSRYKDITHGGRVENGMIELTEKKMNALMGQFETKDELTSVFNEMSHSQILYKTTRIIELIFAGALKFGASDVHIEPEEKKVRLRYRVNGALVDIAFFEFSLLKNIISRLKLLSGLKLSTVASAQDGRFSINLGIVEVDVRVSVVPGNYGESFVMRILDPRNTVKSLDGIAFPDITREAVTRALAKPHGVILTTGPTGSGKTTTLYAFLNHVYTPEVKIITIEDPIEYHFEGITQTQVEEEKEYTFLSGLRAALRQDPDVIMVGEIRDEDTAKVAINAALTGHLVLSTLHTNTAAGTIPRLLDLGVNPKVMAGALSLALAQRLVRKLCEHCKELYESSEKESRLITNILGDMKTSGKEDLLGRFEPHQTYPLFKAVGCPECSGTGYSGRIGIFEAIIITAEIETALLSNPSEREIKKAAKNQKIPSLREDAILKMLSGITSFDEISHVVDLYGED
ncbi:MAG: type pilus assembly ATPase PilB, type pilus assembly protein PilB [Candidatus Parcubacteria bacterium]|jgi:type II secretory ATPase GspE/PulE/Tfp pilus assembly ATPase PilB-like protein